MHWELWEVAEVELLGSQREEVEVEDREELGCGSEARAERKPCDLP